MFRKLILSKSIIYRVFSSVVTFLISFLLTGNIISAMSIGFFDTFVKVFSYYYFDKIWDKYTNFNIKPAVVWLTGLSGSGKTTIAHDLISKLKNKSVIPVLLDGDEIRNAIRQNGFDEKSRKQHNLNVGYMASLMENQGNLVIVSLISPYTDTRNEIRKMCKKFIEVYVSTDLETCISRDVKGLYKKAISGEIKEFTGISAPYNAPTIPEIKIDTSAMSVDECSIIILNYLKK